MKLDSKFFDRLRVKPDAARLVRDACPSCEWQGWAEPGLYPAPKGRGQEGKYHRFCLEHVREYNKSYNYFAGMPDEDVAKHYKYDAIGHRPTWFVGVNSSARPPTSEARPTSNVSTEPIDDVSLFAYGLRCSRQRRRGGRAASCSSTRERSSGSCGST